MSTTHSFIPGYALAVGAFLSTLGDHVLDLSSKLAVAFACGFAGVAGQALWGYILRKRKGDK